MFPRGLEAPQSGIVTKHARDRGEKTEASTGKLLEHAIHSSSNKDLLPLLCAIMASGATKANKATCHPSMS